MAKKKKVDPASEAINLAMQDIEEVLTDIYNLGFDGGFEEATRDDEKGKK